MKTFTITKKIATGGNGISSHLRQEGVRHTHLIPVRESSTIQKQGML
jgi:hypothetical protein